MTLDTSAHLDDPDAIFVALAAAHAGLDAEQSRRLDAALVLLLANQLPASALVLEAIATARRVVLGDAATIGEANGVRGEPE